MSGNRRTYVVAIRGEVPEDIRERVTQAHAQAIAAQKQTARAEQTPAASEIEEVADASGELQP